MTDKFDEPRRRLYDIEDWLRGLAERATILEMSDRMMLLGHANYLTDLRLGVLSAPPSPDHIAAAMREAIEEVTRDLIRIVKTESGDMGSPLRQHWRKKAAEAVEAAERALADPPPGSGGA